MTKTSENACVGDLATKFVSATGTNGTIAVGGMGPVGAMGVVGSMGATGVGRGTVQHMASFASVLIIQNAYHRRIFSHYKYM